MVHFMVDSLHQSKLAEEPGYPLVLALSSNELPGGAPVPDSVLPLATATHLIYNLVVPDAVATIAIAPSDLQWIEGVEDGWSPVLQILPGVCDVVVNVDPDDDLPVLMNIIGHGVFQVRRCVMLDDSVVWVIKTTRGYFQFLPALSQYGVGY
nr:MAG: RNA-dependent RNA polymerase [Nodaviridae sp.]